MLAMKNPPFCSIFAQEQRGPLVQGKVQAAKYN